MTALLGPLDPVSEADAGPAPASEARLPTLLRRPAGVAAFVVLALIVAMAVFAPLLAPDDPVTQNLSVVSVRPWLFGGTTAHFFGTDNLGRDVLSRVIYGARTSLAIGLGCATVATLVGMLLGALAGYFEGAVGVVIRTVGNIEFAVPTVAVGIALAAVIGPGLGSVLTVLTLWSWPISARTISATVSQVSRRDYVAAARLSGVSTASIFRRHLLRPALGPALVLWSTSSGVLIIAESGLSLIGLGVQDPRFSWGSMLADSSTLLRTSWWAVVFPGLAIAITVVAFSVLGDVLRDSLNPRLSGPVRDPELW